MKKYLRKFNKIFTNKLFIYVKLQSLLFKSTFNKNFFFFDEFYKEKKDLSFYLGKYLPKIFIMYLVYIFYFYFLFDYVEYNTIYTFFIFMFIGGVYLISWFLLVKFIYFCCKVLGYIWSKILSLFRKYYNLCLDIKSLFTDKK
jgi:hypothetical protein